MKRDNGRCGDELEGNERWIRLMEASMAWVWWL